MVTVMVMVMVMVLLVMVRTYLGGSTCREGFEHYVRYSLTGKHIATDNSSIIRRTQ